MSSPSISVMKCGRAFSRASHLAPVVLGRPIARQLLNRASCTPCESSVTCSRSGHFVALMRLRRSARSASGALKEKGRIASALVVPICESPWFDGCLATIKGFAVIFRRQTLQDADGTIPLAWHAC